MRTKEKTKRIHIHTYIHTTNSDIHSSLLPKNTTFLFTCKNGIWQLAHTFPYINDKIVRDFTRAYLKQMRGQGVYVRIEKHIFGSGR